MTMIMIMIMVTPIKIIDTIKNGCKDNDNDVETVMTTTMILLKKMTVEIINNDDDGDNDDEYSNQNLSCIDENLQESLMSRGQAINPLIGCFLGHQV